MIVDSGKLGRVTGMLEGKAAIHRHVDVDVLETRADRKLTKVLNVEFSKGKCKVLHLGVNSLTYQYEPGANGKKTLEVQAEQKVDHRCVVWCVCVQRS